MLLLEFPALELLALLDLQQRFLLFPLALLTLNRIITFILIFILFVFFLLACSVRLSLALGVLQATLVVEMNLLRRNVMRRKEICEG